jgi:hypothetical protein
MRVAALCLLPLALVPLLERHGVGDDPAVWLLDCALFISICSVPYFTLVAGTVVGGAALSIGAFQALWTCGASALFVIMEHLESGKGRRYCPLLLWLSHRRFLRQKTPANTALEPERQVMG